MSLSMTCPNCGLEGDLTLWLINEDARAAVFELTKVSVPEGLLIMQYVGLFSPPKRKLGVKRAAKLMLEVLPDLQRGTITLDGRDWATSRAAWRSAIESMLAQRDQGKLTLPMTSHHYLYRILAAQADKVEGQQERERERDAQQRKAPSRVDGSSTGNGFNMDKGFTSVADILAAREARKAQP